MNDVRDFTENTVSIDADTKYVRNSNKVWHSYADAVLFRGIRQKNTKKMDITP
jgi:hypothetical protein